MNIILRPVRESDDPFLLELYASTRAMELAQVPWTELQKSAFLQMQFAAQKKSYAAEYPAATHDLICRDGLPVGRLYLSRKEDRFHILDITVAEHCRKEGVGSAVLKEILQEADAVQKPVSIYIENFNPSLRLFKHLGFQTVVVKDFLMLLERSPFALG